MGNIGNNKVKHMNQRIFNWGWYGFYNFGDDLLQKTVSSYFNRKDSKICFSMQNKYENIISDQVPRTYRNLFGQASKADILIVGPGGLFPFSNTFKLVVYFLAVKWWQLHRKKVVFFGIGISNKMAVSDRFFWRKIVKSSDLFFTRSPNFFTSINLEENSYRKTIADCAFASQVVKPHLEGHRNEHRIGISIANLSKNSNDDNYLRNVRIWSSICKQLLQKGYLIDLIAFTKGKDDKMINDIMKRLKNENISGGGTTVPLQQSIRCCS